MRAAFLVLAAVLALPATAGAVVARDVKILAGSIAAPGQYPWMVALVDASAKNAFDGQYCGGTLIAPRVVLTAAHCVVGVQPAEMDIVVGRTRLSKSDEGERIRASKILRNPNYTREYFDDVALVQLSRPASVLPLPVAAGAEEAQHVAPGARVVVSGWGATAEGGAGSDDLQFVRLTVRSDANCDKVYEDVDADTQVCAGSSRPGEDSCQGDSGGPLFYGEGEAARLVGVVSYGYGCGRAGVPGVYSRVAGFADWLAQQTPVLNGDATAPPLEQFKPRVRIGSITCGSVLCTVGLRVSGRDPSGGILINVVRKKTRTRKAVERFVLAKRSKSGTWSAKADLPYGRLVIYAFPYLGDLEDLDGDGDATEVSITPG
jgi:secreted trypsin-like serine protease